jgi:hypothetical protein
VKKGPSYSTLFSDEGIEIAHTPPDDMNVILVQKYKIKNDKPEKEGNAIPTKLDEFKKKWNQYANVGIIASPTIGWEDNT